jgi:hypothetical protein
MREKCYTVYNFEELEEKTKEKALDELRHINTEFDWWDLVEDDFKILCKLIGVEVKNIYFSGFCSQGDGACFEGFYAYAKGSCRAIRDHAPTDTELHRITDELYQVQAKNFFRLSAQVKQRGHYLHKYCTEIRVDGQNSEDKYPAEEAIIELLRDLMEWLYRTLEKENDYLTSDEAIIETIEANEYEFTENGKRA